MRSLASFLFLFAISFQVWAGNPRITRKQYIEQWSDVAVQNMKKYGIPASIILAQGILESGSGNSTLAQKGNNHFGIKCHDWKGKKIYHDDDKKGECFRKYTSASESYRDHAIFLSGGRRYAFLFDLKVTDYKGWAKGLKKAGYATNPKYPALLIKIIEEEQLHEFDKGGKPRKNPPKETKKPKVNNKPIVEDADDDSPEIFLGRQVKTLEGRLKYVLAKKGDSPEAIARDLELGDWQIRKYNDIDKSYRFSENERVYVKPKRNKGRQKAIVMSESATIWKISQVQGVKLSRLLKYNEGLTSESVVEKGSKVYLRKP